MDAAGWGADNGELEVTQKIQFKACGSRGVVRLVQRRSTDGQGIAVSDDAMSGQLGGLGGPLSCRW